MNDIKPRTNLSVPEPKWIKCQVCNGRGLVRRYPYYAEEMPTKKDTICEYCDGYGKVLFVYKYVKVVRE